MPGLHPETPTPTTITLHTASRLLEIGFDDDRVFQLPAEFLRVWSPSAEVRGHGPGQEQLQTGKRNVSILSIEAVGNYAIRPIFSDGHSSGLYSWDILYYLGSNQAKLWDDYLQRLEAAGASRDVATPPPAGGHGCGGKHK